MTSVHTGIQPLFHTFAFKDQVHPLDPVTIGDVSGHVYKPPPAAPQLAGEMTRGSGALMSLLCTHVQSRPGWGGGLPRPALTPCRPLPARPAPSPCAVGAGRLSICATPAGDRAGVWEVFRSDLSTCAVCVWSPSCLPSRCMAWLCQDPCLPPSSPCPGARDAG